MNGAVNRVSELDASVTHEQVVISAPNLRTVEFNVQGVTPLCVHRFSEKAKRQMMDSQKAGSTAKSKRKREPRDFDADYEGAKYISTDGWCGLPAGAFRSAMIDACRLVGFRMTNARLAVFIVADGFDDKEGTPLVRIYGDPQKIETPMKNDNGSMDIRARPFWSKWSVKLRVRYDADQFTLADVTNLLNRAGMQVGVGEGRNNSRQSNGCGWGEFSVDAK